MAARQPSGAVATHARIHSVLREALMNGDFHPGQRLVVRSLAERFQTSPMPVREALRQLVSDEALFDHVNRGVIVPEASVEVISDLTRVRCSIEGSAAGWAAGTITRSELADIRALNEAIKDCVAQGAAADYLSLNRKFHFAVYRSARSAVLLGIIERLWLRAGPWLNIMRQEATLGLGLEHHAEIIDALEKGDREGARRAVAIDIADAADVMLRAVGDFVADETRRERGRPRKSARGVQHV